MVLVLCAYIACFAIATIATIAISSYVKISFKGAGLSKTIRNIQQGDKSPEVAEDSNQSNYLRNNCGQEQFQHWEIVSESGSGWAVEETPVGIERVPAAGRAGIPISDFGECSSCFATSYGFCEKLQLIDLLKQGVSANTLDTIQPPIEVGEWYACRIGSESAYELEVKLLDQERKCVSVFEKTDDFSSTPKDSWQKVMHTFKNYGRGVRYVSFRHGGGDSRKLPGHYGCKISGGVVKIICNKSLNQQTNGLCDHEES